MLEKKSPLVWSEPDPVTVAPTTEFAFLLL